MPQAVYKNAFNAGVMDPILESRIDLRRWKSALLTGTNVTLAPQGGARRRPGLAYVETLASATRLDKFRVGYSLQYLLVWRDLFVDVFSGGTKLTQIVSPYPAADLPEIDTKAQSADTKVIFHEDHAPHRLLRATITSGGIETDGSTGTVVVRVSAHGLLDGEKVGLSGLTAVGGITAAQLNTSQTVARIDGSLGANPVATTSGSKTVVVTIAGHTFAIGERIEIAGLSSVGGIPAAEFNRIRTITNVSAGAWVSFGCETEATATVAGGGGSAGTWNAPDKFHVTTAGTSTSATTGGGASGLCWVLHSLAKNVSRTVAFTNIPQFDYADASSPGLSDEVQRLTFENFVEGDRYRLEVEAVKTEKLDYSADNDINAQIMQDALNADTTGITVTYDAGGSPGEQYVVRFAGDAGRKAWGAITPNVTNSTSGTISVDVEVEGGSTAEDVFSATRGYPRAGMFHQRRLWMIAPRSRPLTVIASKTEDFFNLDVGDALPSDAIDSTTEFDPLRHIIADRGVYVLTTGSEVAVREDAETGGFVPPLKFDILSRFGSSSVQPASLAGRPMYVDSTGRSVRQLSFDLDTNAVEAVEVSQFSQFLIVDPTKIEAIRNDEADFLYVVNTDGTIAVFTYEPNQSVAGWTKFVTDGAFEDVVEVGNVMYAAVARTINGSAVRYLERFDATFYTDAGEQQTGASSASWSGFSHLEAETVDVRADGATVDQVTVASGAVTASSGGADFACTAIEVGLPFDVTVEPTPPVLGRKTRLIAVTVDLYQTREIKVGGFVLETRQTGAIANPVALATGFYRVPLRGWGQRKTVEVTQRAPQPFHLRGLEVEVA